MRKLRGINLAIVILSCVLILAMGFGYAQINNDKIAKNTYIKDINVGNLSKEEAKAKIEKKCKIETITFTYKGKEWNINSQDIDTNYDIEKTVENAFNVNRSKNVLTNTVDMLKSTFGIKNKVNIVLDCDKEKLEKELNNIAKEINVDMENASLDTSNENIKINKEKAGIQLDLSATLANLEKSLQDGIYKESLVVTKVEPKITVDDLKNINTLLGSYKTTLSDISEGRVENIKLATERTSGILLMPGEEFSYNEYTGLRTTLNGYKNATVIVSGEAVQGIGGGVCQVSTTLYNAVLYAGLDIVKISNHSIPSSYVEKGRDATVSDSGLDFVFKNNYKQPVYIKNHYSNGVITCQIYGNHSNKQDIEIITNIDKIEDAPVKKEKDITLDEGTEKVLENGRSGYTVSTYRVYYDKNRNEIEKEKVAVSYYPSKHKVVAVGTKKEEIDLAKDEEAKDEEKENLISNENNNDKQDDDSDKEIEVDKDEIENENSLNEEEISTENQ